jgi:hypothetical protein
METTSDETDDLLLPLARGEGLSPLSNGPCTAGRNSMEGGNTRLKRNRHTIHIYLQ